MANQRFRVCVIDGDGDSVAAVSDALASLNADIVGVSDGAKGLSALMRRSFDLIILDLMLDQLSGFELVERIRSEGPNSRTPVVVVSPLVIDDTLVSEDELNVDALLPKPLDQRELERAARSILEPSSVELEAISRRKLLLVEDNEYNAELVRLRLGQETYDVSHAVDGQGALRAFERIHPDVVLLDIQIPSPNGLEVLREIRAHDQDVLVVMMTAFGSEKVAVEAMKIGADEYLTKPLEHRKLERFLDEAWVRSRLKAENRQLVARLWLSTRELLGQYKATSAAMLALREKQDELVRAQRLAAVTEAAVSINHEINNPLCSIVGNADLLLRKHPAADPDIIRKVRSIERESQRIREITKKLASLANVVTTQYAGGVQMIDIDRSLTTDSQTPSQPKKKRNRSEP